MPKKHSPECIKAWALENGLTKWIRLYEKPKPKYKPRDGHVPYKRKNNLQRMR
jgi:hypothetical protein